MAFDSQPRYSPDGSQVLFVSDRDGSENLWLIDVESKATRQVTDASRGWSTAGRHEEQTGLRLRELVSGDERWLAYPVQRDDQESIAGADVLPGMSFTPDSSEVVVSYGGKIWRVPTAEGAEPIPVPFRVRTELEIGPELAFDYPVDDSARFTVRQIRDAVPSPDGSTLAFAALDRLYVSPIPDGEPRRLTALDSVEAQPAWSPDGVWIAFVTWSPDGGHLYKARADGSAPPVRLSTRPAIFQRPAWSPDGERPRSKRRSPRLVVTATVRSAFLPPRRR